MDKIIPLEIILAGIAIALALLVKHTFTRIKLPSIVGYLILGFLIRIFGVKTHLLTEDVLSIFEFLGNLGLIILLFRVGLHSNISGLKRQLGPASFIWLSNVTFSGGIGYAAAYYGLGLGLIPSLFLGIALTATSVGVSIAVWQEAQSLNSPNGELLIDVAEMDDISSVMLMSVLLATVPALKGAVSLPLSVLAAKATALLLLKVLLFGMFCLFLSRFVDELLKYFGKIHPAPDPMLLVAGIGLIIAGLAGWFGFSVAVGALFAGFVFSHNPRTVRDEVSYGTLFELLTPFFFIDIGLRIDHTSLISASNLGLVLILVAVIGKIVGTSVPAWFARGRVGSILISVSMIPRAEIAMVVMQHGRRLGDWAVPPHVFSAMVLVSAFSCLLTPLMLRPLLNRWPQAEERL